MNKSGKRVAVIGSGLGGLSAAITCAAKGLRVAIFEKNDKIGGKLNISRKEGFSFDLGPSILTLPSVFRDLFAKAGLRFEDHVPIRPLQTHWRNFFEDGACIDLVADLERQKTLLAAVDTEAPAQFDRFMAYARRQYELSDRNYLRGFDSPMEIILDLWGNGLTGLDLLRSMHRGVSSYFTHPKLRDIFDYFAKYIGSSPFNAPGVINLMPWVQYCYGLWYVEGGMYRLAEGLKKALEELSAELHLNREVISIDTDGSAVTSITLADGEQVKADFVISNMEFIPAHERLLKTSLGRWTRRRLEPACSGLVIHLGVKKVYPQLAHHNFFFSKNSREHFRDVFDRHCLPKDPTIYLVAPTRTDPSVAPDGCDNLKLLPHIPTVNPQNPVTAHEYVQLRELVLEKCERMGLTDLRSNIVVEETWTPPDIERNYYSNRGAIYGVVSDRWRNLAFKASKKSARYNNLYFTGGSINPGGGMPMVTACGMQVGEKIAESL
ncbi:MAG: phytoene desaturase [Geobacteraceae bacterium]|nr:phytoene desaturase [Geobacteraceae bacterium]